MLKNTEYTTLLLEIELQEAIRLTSMGVEERRRYMLDKLPSGFVGSVSDMAEYYLEEFTRENASKEVEDLMVQLSQYGVRQLEVKSV